MADWGQARKEVLANKPLIQKRIVEGCSIRSIWIELKASGCVTVALRNFHSQVKKQLGYLPGKPLPGSHAGMVVTPSASNTPSLSLPITNAFKTTPAPDAAPGAVFGASGLKMNALSPRVSFDPAPEDAKPREPDDAS